ncbi:MAG: glycosyltransferase family 39 protein [Thermoanaerobaculia bacterium]
MSPPPRTRLAALLLLAVFAILCVHGLLWDTPTVDEIAYLPSGWYTLHTGKLDLFPLCPPLVKILSALPLLSLNPRLDPAARIENSGWYPWIYGTDFMERNRAGYDRIFLLGRLPVLVLGLLTCWLVFRWARELYGDEAGLVALFLAVFFPSLIAHAHLATVDVGLCFFFLLALYLFWRFVQRPAPALLAACGLALGLAQLSKFTALILYPVFLLLALTAEKRRKSLASLALIFLLSLVVIDAGYLFRGLGRPLGSFRFESRLLGRVAAILPAGLPMPLPATYLEGFDSLQVINDVGEYPEYLFGRWSREGSPAYYLVVILFKTPLPLLAALLIAPFARFREARGQSFLWLPALVLLAFFSTARVHYGIRYILAIFPLLFIYAGRLVPWVRSRGRAIQAAAVALLLAYPLSALVTTPDSISYFNLLAAGRGDEILLDSNIDWGQGLKRVRAYMDREGIDRIGLAYFGHVDPALYGIDWDFPRPDRPGLVAVSANFLHGYPYATYAGGRMVPVPPDAFTWIAKHQRVADLGGGMFVYRVGPALP